MMKNLKLIAAREQLNISQFKLSERLLITSETMKAIENGEYNPSLALCRAICKELGKTLDELFWEG